jgi:uncharacterized protein (TIGR00369 family)
MNERDLQAIVDRSPMNQWLGMTIREIAPGRVTIAIRWREELISSPERQSIHGGIIATIIDGAGNYALAAVVGGALPTISLSVDYHRRAGPGELTAVARPVHIGRTISTADVLVYDRGGKLVASGRGSYLGAGSAR